MISPEGVNLKTQYGVVGLFFFFIFIITLSMVSAGTFTTVHEFDGVVSNENYQPISGWSVIHQFHGAVLCSSLDAGSGGSGGTVNWVTFILWMMIIWLPAMMLNIVAPGYGLLAGVVIMGVIVNILFFNFVVVLVIIIFNAGILIWKGIS